MHTGQHDHIGIDFRSLARQGKAVADDIGHAMEDFRGLVIMRQNDGIALFFNSRIAATSLSKPSHSAFGIIFATRS